MINFRNGQTALCSDLFGSAQICQTVNGRSDNVARIVRTKRLGSDIGDTSRLNDRTNLTAGDNACAFRRRLQQNSACAECADYFVRNGSSLQGNLNQIFLCVFDAFSDSIRNLARFTHAKAYDAVAVTHNNQCCEFEDTAAFYGFGYTVNRNNVLFEIQCCCINFSQTNNLLALELEAALTSTISQFFYTAVIQITASVENDFFNILLSRSFRDCLTDLACSFLVAAVAFKAFVHCGRRRQCHAIYVVNKLCVNVFIRAKYVQAWTLRSARDFAAHPAGSISLPDAAYTIELFACVMTDAYDTAIYTPERYPDDVGALLDYAAAQAVQQRDIGVTAQDRLVALSTCAGSETNGRVVVLGRLCPLKEGDEMQ